jgi:hypothetical protein
MYLRRASATVRPQVSRGLRGLGQATVPVNVGPGTTVMMSPADAASYWGTSVPAAPGSYGGYQGTGGSVTAASGATATNPFGIYAPAVQTAWQQSPTIQGMIPQTPQLLAAPGYTPGSPQYTTSNTGGFSTKVLTLDSFLQQLLSEMTSSGPQSTAASGGAGNLLQQAIAYCGATGLSCPNIQAAVAPYQQWFTTWAGETLVPQVTPTGVAMQWSGGSPLNYGPGGQMVGPQSGALSPGSVQSNLITGNPVIPGTQAPSFWSSVGSFFSGGSSPSGGGSNPLMAPGISVSASGQPSIAPGAASALQAPVGSTGIPLWVLLAGGGLAAWMFLK